MPVTNLPFIQKEIIRYVVTLYLVLGILGNIFNCIMFTRHAYRRSPSSFYLLSLSIFAMIYLIWTLSPIIYTLNYIDPQTQSVLYCKIRQYGSHSLSIHIRYTIVLACADQFLVTRTNNRIRSLSSVQMARKLVIIMCAISLLIALHMPILMDIRNGVCGMFGDYKLQYAIYQIIVLSILPPVLMSIFSVLTIRSLHQRHRISRARIQQKDRQFTRMVIAEVMVTICSSIPFSANLFYGAFTNSITNKSAERLEIESFITFITQVIINILAVAPFYLFVLASKPFRKEFIGLFANLWYKHIIRPARIVPLTTQNITILNHGRVTYNKQ